MALGIQRRYLHYLLKIRIEQVVKNQEQTKTQKKQSGLETSHYTITLKKAYGGQVGKVACKLEQSEIKNCKGK